MRRFLAIILVALIAVSCDKEIDLGYRSIEAKYVIVSHTNENETYVNITRTSDMNSPMDRTPVAADQVKVTDKSGVEYILTQNEDGEYVSNAVRVTNVGDSFTLEVDIDGEVYSSTSTVMAKPEESTMGFVIDVVMGIKGVSCKVDAVRGDLDDRYFRYLLYHNGEYLDSGATKKSSDDTSAIGASIFFAAEEEGVLKSIKDDEIIINDGDDITVEFFAIDATSYQYFYTLSLASQTSSNPVPCFTGGCLGYYTAYYTNTLTKQIVW